MTRASRRTATWSGRASQLAWRIVPRFRNTGCPPLDRQIRAGEERFGREAGPCKGLLGALGHAADGVDRRPGEEPLQHELAGEADPARSHQRLAQVEVEVALAAAREDHALPAERDRQDQLEQLAAARARPGA